MSSGFFVFFSFHTHKLGSELGDIFLAVWLGALFSKALTVVILVYCYIYDCFYNQGISGCLYNLF